MKEKEAKKLGLNKITIANLGDHISDLDKVKGGTDTNKCPFTDTYSPPPTEDPISCP